MDNDKRLERFILKAKNRHGDLYKYISIENKKAKIINPK